MLPHGASVSNTHRGKDVDEALPATEHLRVWLAGNHVRIHPVPLLSRGAPDGCHPIRAQKRAYVKPSVGPGKDAESRDIRKEKPNDTLPFSLPRSCPALYKPTPLLSDSCFELFEVAGCSHRRSSMAFETRDLFPQGFYPEVQLTRPLEVGERIAIFESSFCHVIEELVPCTLYLADFALNLLLPVLGFLGESCCMTGALPERGFENASTQRVHCESFPYEAIELVASEKSADARR
jgi:hypothetical protein